MNPFEDRSETIPGAVIDRLVDGGLPEIERRALLLRLENDPDGWRRVALAFLEDQAWRAALAPIVPVLSEPLPMVAVASGRPKRRWSGRVSIAASLLAAVFTAGFAAGFWKGGPNQVDIARVDPSEQVEASPALGTNEILEVGSFQVVDASLGETPPARFPILSGPGLDDEWLRMQPPAVPEYLRARWEREGYQVAEHRNVMSVELGDGRHVSIPVDEVELDYVGQQPL